MKKKYIKPAAKAIPLSASLLCSSSSAYDHICTDRCRYWHRCLDRKSGKTCYDKKY